MTNEKKGVTGKCDALQQPASQEALSKEQRHVNSVPFRIQVPGSGEATVLLDLVKSEHQRLRVDIHEFRGKQFIGIRNWYRSGYGAEWTPSNSGVSMRPNQVAAIVQALMLAGQASNSKRDA
ncbi:hypothetical protein BURK_001690 [Burkholderia sp. SJ98]|nr:hypothetical protein BURK_001690 [Burkholderia sp. SJ98]